MYLDTIAPAYAAYQEKFLIAIHHMDIANLAQKLGRDSVLTNVLLLLPFNIPGG